MKRSFTYANLMDQAVVDDGTADFLVQLVQRLHLVH
jgi:hypothetical protein